MAKFCSNCGAGPLAGAKFCAECGAPVAEPTGAVPAAAPPSGGEAMPADPAAPPPLSQTMVIALCYLFLLVAGAILLLLDPYRRDKEVRFHAWQSILFFGLIVAVNVLGLVLQWLGLSLFVLLRLGLLVGYLALLIQAFRGKKLRLPVLGDLAEQLAART